MFKSIYFKVILILVIFIITVMCVVGVILLNSISQFYTTEFINQMDNNFSQNSPDNLRSLLAEQLSTSGFAANQKDILNANSGTLGIDEYRNYYILDMNGTFIAGSDEEHGNSVKVTPNLLAAINRQENNKEVAGDEYSDYAVYLKQGSVECIIYIKDTLEEMQQLNWILFSRILQSIFLGLIIAIILSFFLAKAITSPIQNLTYGAQLVSSGEFSHEIDVHSNDEIGILTDTFNHMKDILKSMIGEVEGEKEKLETVFSYLKDAVITFGEDKKVLQTNSAAMELFGKDTILDENFTLEKMLSLLGIVFDKNSAKSSDGEKTGETLVFRDRVYGDRVLDVSFGVITYPKDGVTKDGLITVIHDITSRYELDRSRRDFVANVSHELKTPLHTINGACATIFEDETMNKEDRDYFLDMAITECARMKSLVDQLLILSRLDNKGTKWDIEEFDIKDSIRKRCEAMHPEIEQHRHKLQFLASKEVIKITADRQRIEEVVANIISNAAKYTPDGGIIKIAVSRENQNVKIQIADNGIGIPKEDIEHIFERFYRVEKSRTSETGGTGLGLAIAKETIMAHGGTIDVESEVNKGTVFTIILPIKTKLKNS